MIVEKTEFNFDLKSVSDDVRYFIQKYPHMTSLGLTHSVDANTEEERLRDCIGSTDFIKRNKPDTDFDIFNKSFAGTSLQLMYETLSTKFKLCRFRIMIMGGPMAYYAHSDPTRRLHYVIETNKDCIFLFPEVKEQFHIPADGNVYMVDTRLRHTFVNASNKTRIHLLLSLFSETE